MKRLINLITLFAGIVLVACDPVQEEPDFTGSITGVVYANDEPIQGVNVTLTPGGDSFITKADGAYSFKNLKPEKYTLNFNKKGYKAVSKTITVTAGGNASGDVMMEVDPNSLSLDKELLAFGAKSNELEFSLTNSGINTVTWEAKLADTNDNWITLSEDKGSIPSNGVSKISVKVDRSKIEGNKADANIHITTNTSQSLNVKMEVTAGEPAKIEVLLLYAEPTGYVISLVPSHNTSKYFVLSSHKTSLTVEEVLAQNGKWYEGNATQDEVSFFNLPTGVDQELYIIAYNEYGQQSKMDSYLIELSKANSIAINSNNFDFGTDKNSLSIELTNNSADNAEWYIANYTSTDPWLTISSTQGVMAANNVTKIELRADRSKLNGSYASTSFDILTRYQIFHITVTVSANEDVSSPAYVDAKFGKISAHEIEVTLTPTSNTSKWYYGIIDSEYAANVTADMLIDPKTEMLGSEAASGTFGNIEANTEYSLFTLAFNEYGQQGPLKEYRVTTAKEDKPKVHTLSDYLGYWDVSGEWYDWYSDTAEEIAWERLSIETIEFSNQEGVWVVVNGLLFGEGYDYFHAIGEFDEARGMVNLYGGMSITGRTYHYNSDPDTSYKGIFFPVYCYWDNGVHNESSLEVPSGEYRILSLSLNDNGVIRFAGGPKADNNGNYANGFYIVEQNVDDAEDYSWLPTVYDVTMTKSANQAVPKSFSTRYGLQTMNYYDLMVIRNAKTESTHKIFIDKSNDKNVRKFNIRDIRAN